MVKIYIIGNSKYKPKNFNKIEDLTVNVFEYKNNLENDIKDSSLIISHCGKNNNELIKTRIYINHFIIIYIKIDDKIIKANII